MHALTHSLTLTHTHTHTHTHIHSRNANSCMRAALHYRNRRKQKIPAKSLHIYYPPPLPPLLSPSPPFPLPNPVSPHRVSQVGAGRVGITKGRSPGVYSALREASIINRCLFNPRPPRSIGRRCCQRPASTVRLASTRSKSPNQWLPRLLTAASSPSFRSGPNRLTSGRHDCQRRPVRLDLTWPNSPR